MEISPFPFQGPLDPAEVTGRDALLTDLTERVTARRVTALLGPRRYGKTSVLRRLAADLSEVTTVWVDLYEVSSTADVVIRLDEALGATSGRFGKLLRQLSLGFSLGVGVASVELKRRAPDRPEASVLLHTQLRSLVAVAERHPTLLVIDEFSSIAAVRPAAGALRTALQHHYRDLGILFAGSHPSMMRTLFTARAEPFYAQADLVEMPGLDLAAVEAIVTSGFDSSGRDPGHLAARIHAVADEHPQRTMQLADACWRHCAAGSTADDLVWAAGLADVRHAVDTEMERLFATYNQGERSVLRAVAKTGRIYGSEAELLELSAGAASHARQALIDSGDLKIASGGLRVVDPLLADWLRTRFSL